MGGNSNSFKITTGRRSCPVSFRMQVFHPNIKERCPVIVDGDMCFAYLTTNDYIKTALDKNIAWAFFDRTELAHDVGTEGRGHGQLYRTYPEYTFGALGAWAWGYSRCVDALIQLGIIDEMQSRLQGIPGAGKPQCWQVSLMNAQQSFAPMKQMRGLAAAIGFICRRSTKRARKEK